MYKNGIEYDVLVILRLVMLRLVIYGLFLIDSLVWCIKGFERVVLSKAALS